MRSFGVLVLSLARWGDCLYLTLFDWTAHYFCEIYASYIIFLESTILLN